MPKASKLGYYAVRAGRSPGIYRSWADCEAQIKGFTNAAFKRFDTEAEASEFLTTGRRTALAPAASSSRTVVTPSRPKIKDPVDADVVYCDGACKGNGRPGSVAGIGVWWGHGDARNISERCPGDQTNNRAELIAIVRILETTPRLKRRLVIKTDSHYSIQCVTSWISGWMRNGFRTSDGKPVKNQALIRYLAALLHVRRKTSQTVEFVHVRGHVGIEGNEAADQLANLGATKQALPERDWQRLEKEALKDLGPIKPIRAVDDDLKAYADGLLSDDELADLSDASVGNVASPQLVPSQSVQLRASVSSPRTSLQCGPSTVHRRSKLPFNDGSVDVKAAPPKQVPISRAELEAYAACLLGEDELATLGRDGVFDSDF